MRLLRHAPIALLLISPGVTAFAQVLERPPRTTGGLFGGHRPVDPNHIRQELTLTLNVLAGYGDVLLNEGQSEPTSPGGASGSESSYSGFAAATGRYWLGRAARHIEASGSAQMISYSTVLSGPLVGGHGSVSAVTSLGRRTSMDAGFRTEYRPTFVLGSVGDVSAASGGVELDPTAGATEIRTLSTGAHAGVRREWTTRQHSTFEYSLGHFEFTGGPDANSTMRGQSLAHSWQFARTSAIQLGYRYATWDSIESTGGATDSSTHNADLGFDYRKRLSPTRQLAFAFGAGVMRGQATNGETYTAPSAHGSAQFDFARTWNIGVGLQRHATVLEGITRSSFLTSTTGVTFGGRMHDRVTLAFSGQFSRGAAPAGEAGSFETISGTVQVDYALGRWGSLVTNYSSYDHTLRGVTGIPVGLPTRFQRSSVRVGFTVWLPLYGSFEGERGRTTPRS